jgi:coenzyme F420 hydrogenase subunit beta
MHDNGIGGQRGLLAKVFQNGLCTACGACVNLCPYQKAHRDRVVVLDQCDRDQGRCFQFCPRTPTDWGAMLGRLFDPADLTPELGAVKGYYLCRAADSKLRALAQHGGSVSALMALALEEGLVNHAILTEGGEGLAAQGAMVKRPEDVWSRAGSRFVGSPTLASFNQAASGGQHRLGVVATPCQAQALAKMKLAAGQPEARQQNPPTLVIGLFCGWVLDREGLGQVLSRHLLDAGIRKLDIPPSMHHCLEATTSRETCQISLDEITPWVRDSCRYCSDFTSEFADISVGSARLPQGWEAARGWNQVLVRSQAGMRLLEAALARGVIEVAETQPDGLEKLKRAAWQKKRAAVRNLIAKSGDPGDLIYLDAEDPVFGSFTTGAPQNLGDL